MIANFKNILFRLEALDLWFLGLRVFTILVGLAWYAWVPYDPARQSLFALLLWGMVGYTTLLYACIFLRPAKIRYFYLLALVIDLGLIFIFIRHVAHMQGSFFIAFYLLIGLHSFYFGPRIGLLSATMATALYTYIYFEFARPISSPEFILRISFLFLIAISFGLLSVKGRRDTEKIERLNQQLAHRNEVLMQVYRYLSIGKLAPGISEKVNNPMAVIMGRAAILQKEARSKGLPEEIVEGLGVILSHAQHVALTFKNLVTFLAGGSAEAKRVDLNEVANDALWVMEGRLEERRVKVERKLSEGPFFILGAARELKEAIVHLFNNAVDALPQGGVIQVEISRESRSPDQILLRISDNGVGIREEDMEKIFLPFFTTKAAGNGVGLGLSIALNIIKEHNGIVSVKSEWGRGTTLTVAFPPYDGTREGQS